LAGGFLGRDWGDAATQQLHSVSVRHERLAGTLGVDRKLPTMSVTAGGSAKVKSTGLSC
jgi:hypothetical protein